VVVGALAGHFFPHYILDMEPPKCGCLGSAGVSPAAFGVPPNAFELRHPRLGRGSGSWGKIDQPPLCRTLLQPANKMPSPIKKKKLDYPDQTEGSRLAARIRQRANKMPSAQREESLKKAISIIYGGKQAPKATGARH
jgi:hypothetical protein